MLLYYNISSQEPHGGKLVDSMIYDASAKEAAIKSCDFEVELTFKSTLKYDIMGYYL